MRLENEERAIIGDIAAELQVAPAALAEAVEHESVPMLAALLRIDHVEADARLEPIRRVVMMEGDWGAGCWLMNEELRIELRAALRALLPRDHSASSGDSHG